MSEAIRPTQPLRPLTQRADIELPTARLSFSQVRSWLTCAACYEAQYVRKQARTVSPSLAIGSAVHAALEVARSARLNGIDWTLEESLEAAEDAHQDTVRGISRDGYAPDTEPLLRLTTEFKDWDQVKDTAVTLVRHALPAILDAEAGCAVLAVEPEIDMSAIFPFPFLAYADVLLDDSSWETFGTLKDTKTAHRDSIPDDWAAWQLALYYLPWWKAREPLELGIDQVVRQKSAPIVHLCGEPGYCFTPSDAQLRRLIAVVTHVAEQISAGNFPPSPNPFGCDFDHGLPKFGIVADADLTAKLRPAPGKGEMVAAL